MDGTLVNTGSVITKTINYVRANLGLEELDSTLLLDKINDPYINPAEFFYQTKEFTKEQTELFNNYYDKHCIDDVEIYDGIYDILLELKNKDYKLFVATNAFDNYANEILLHTKIRDFFQDIIGANNVTNPKPHPEMILKIMQKNTIKAHETILIGDSYKDKLSANKAGIKSILVHWGFTNHSNNEKAVKDTKELLQIFFKDKNEKNNYIN